MKTFLYCEAGFVEKDQWLPNSWVNVECPTPEDIQYLLNQFHVPESFLSDIADTDERPRIEYEGNWLLTILRIPVQSKESGIPFTTVPIGIILRLIHSSAVWFLKYLKQINNEVARAEKALEKSIRNEDLLRLMKLEKSMVYFNTSIRGNEVMLSKLQSIFQEPMYMDAELLEDVETELKQAHLTVNIYSDILTGTMDAFASIISNNVNTIMKRMTSISIILMVPTLIASFYGMNVVNYIEDAPHGLIAIVLLSITLSALAFFIFRKIKWF